jgi:hypothetical protein
MASSLEMSSIKGFAAKFHEELAEAKKAIAIAD